jgi:hypothetical protein
MGTSARSLGNLRSMSLQLGILCSEGWLLFWEPGGRESGKADSFRGGARALLLFEIALQLPPWVKRTVSWERAHSGVYLGSYEGVLIVTHKRKTWFSVEEKPSSRKHHPHKHLSPLNGPLGVEGEDPLGPPYLWVLTGIHVWSFDSYCGKNILLSYLGLSASFGDHGNFYECAEKSSAAFIPQ